MVCSCVHMCYSVNALANLVVERRFVLHNAVVIGDYANVMQAGGKH